MRELVTPGPDPAPPAVYVARSGTPARVWIRGSGHRKSERWHRGEDIPAGAGALTHVVVACGAYFSLDEVTDLAYSGWVPDESSRCPGCDIAG